MSSHIVSQQVKTGPETHPSVSGANRRAERTPGEVAVSGGVRQESTGGEHSLPVLPPTNAIPIDGQAGQTAIKTTRIVSFAKIKALLQPIHRFFEDKLAEIVSFRLYEDKKNYLAYPEVKSKHRDNPYRRYRLNRKASARTYKRMRQFVENQKLDDFEVADLTLTMPKLYSEYLSSLGHRGRETAWRLFEGFWSEDLPSVINQEIMLGSHTNLHLWRSEVPVEPHYHFHCLIPNYGLAESKTIKDESGDPALEFIRWKWHRQRGGKMVPFTNSQLNELKELWKARLERFGKRHNLPSITGKVNIYVAYVDTWVKFLHKLNYNGRHWSENYAEYSNENPGCQDPPDWLLRYDNKARVRGWWSNLKNITVDNKEVEKISPYTGEVMEYKGREYYWSLLDWAGGQLGYVDFVKGKPVEGVLDQEQLDWLKGVMYRTPMERLLDDMDLDTT